MRPETTAAETLLEKIRKVSGELERVRASAQEEMDAVAARHAPVINRCTELLARYDKELRELMKRERDAIFSGRDKISLPSGVLLHRVEQKITLPRDIVDRLEQAGLAEAIRIRKSVDRNMIKKWGDQKIIELGGTVRPVETFEYEVAR
jgi:phage host-nuclease inhibitor protein Gam